MRIEKATNPVFYKFMGDWTSKYQLLIGGYGSGKSYHIALKLILKALSEKRVILVVREVYDTLRDSCLSLLEEVIQDLGIEKFAHIVKSPHRIDFFNGSKVIFRGLSEYKNLKSLNNVSIVWIEEASEIAYDAYKEISHGRIRHPTLSTHIILSTNPVPEGKSNWIYKHFFESRNLDENILYAQKEIRTESFYYNHSTASDNLFLPRSYVQQLEEMKTYDPDMYEIARHGKFIAFGEKVFPQFSIKPHMEVMKDISNVNQGIHRIGMDFGFVTSSNALVEVMVDPEEKILYIFKEYYKNKTTDDITAKELVRYRDLYLKIRADAAEPKTIAYFRQQGFNMTKALKFKGSRVQYTKKIRRFKKIICSIECENTVRELKDLTYKKDRRGTIIEDEFNIDPHTLSAIWYALDDYDVADYKAQFKSPESITKGSNWKGG